MGNKQIKERYMKDTMRKRARRKGRHAERGILLYILAGSVAAIIIAVTVFLMYDKLYYGKRWYQGTTVNGVDVSGQTLAESRETIIQQYADYGLDISGRGYGTLFFRGDEIDYNFDTGESFEQAFQDQHQQLSLISQDKSFVIDYDVTYSPDKLKDLVKNSELVKGGNIFHIQKPESAYVEYSEEKQQYVMVEEVPGNKIKVPVFLSVLDEVLLQAQTELDLTEEKYSEVYKTPKKTTEDKELQKELTACNNAALRFIEWNMEEGVKESITPLEMSQWIHYKDGEIEYDTEAIKEWVESFCLKYKTVGKTRIIKSHTGKEVEIKGGDYGWQLNYEKTLEQAEKAIYQEIDADLVAAYIENPGKKNKKALTLKRKVSYLNTAYQRDYENFAVDWDTDNYVEVSLADQKVYVFRKGKVAFSCRCITGRPVEGRTTPTGAFFIKEHREEYTLTGEDYETPVKNWVRVTWTGTGFHPATWQPWSRWSKDLYKTRGSHGCINLSVEDAETIYKMTSYREAVFIY